MSVAAYTDVGTALGRLISDPLKQAQVSWWLGGAELAIVSRFGPVADLDTETVKYVEAEAVAARVRAIEDGDSVTVAVDDGSVTRRWKPMTEEDISDSLWGMLSPARSSSAYTIGVSSPLDVP